MHKIHLEMCRDMDTRTCLEILEDLVLLPNNAMVEKQVSSEL